MKNKSILITVCCVLLLGAFVLGASGAVNLSAVGENTPEPARLIGFYAVFDADLAKIIESGQRYFYAEQRTETDGDGNGILQYGFGDIPGFFMMHVRMEDGAAPVVGIFAEKISEIHSNYTDNNISAHSGTLYLCSDRADRLLWTFNVYETSDGTVYFDTATVDGASTPAFSGAEVTISRSETFRSADGTEESVSVALRIAVMMHPQNTVKILEMDAQNRVIRENEIPLTEEGLREYAPDSRAEYLIIEQRLTENETAKTERKVCSRGDDRAEIFYADEEGICVPLSVALRW